METSGWDILTALQTALFISTMTEITFILPHPSSTSISPFLTHLQRVEHFISRFPSVKNISLRLANTGCDCLSVGGDAELRAWASKFGSLLNCILGRQCVATVARQPLYQVLPAPSAGDIQQPHAWDIVTHETHTSGQMGIPTCLRSRGGLRRSSNIKEFLPSSGPNLPAHPFTYSASSPLSKLDHRHPSPLPYHDPHNIEYLPGRRSLEGRAAPHSRGLSESHGYILNGPGEYFR